MQKPRDDFGLLVITRAIITVAALSFVLIGGFIALIAFPPSNTAEIPPYQWEAPDYSTIPADEAGELIRYGQSIITNTSYYLGPKGKVASISNGMNCQNCHLDAGTKFFGNNFSAVASTYPKYRPRYGGIESIESRINDCFERSLNGRPLDSSSREMKAIVAYMKWLGKDVKKGESPAGSGLVSLPYLNRAASVIIGKKVFEEKCTSCHGNNGLGMELTDGSKRIASPLWGAKSYNVGAGLYRLSRFAGFVKANMPLGATAANPKLTDEEAWDVAAFINSLPRPGMNLKRDWPDISKKPVDYPFGPFADTFNTDQHKYGPFGPILKARESLLQPKQQH